MSLCLFKHQGWGPGTWVQVVGAVVPRSWTERVALTVRIHRGGARVTLKSGTFSACVLGLLISPPQAAKEAGVTTL